jgi:hypothetical protein
MEQQLPLKELTIKDTRFMDIDDGDENITHMSK